MLPEAHPLIEKVTEPLAANAERRLAAHAFLGEKFDAAHPGVAKATARIEAAGRRKFPVMRKVLPWVLAALALLPLIALHEPSFRYAQTIYDFDALEPMEKPALPAGLTEEQLLLLGDPTLERIEQKRRLHLHDPENPAYFAEYIHRFASVKTALPPDMLETAARIAPENAYFSYYAAARPGRGSVTKKRSSGSSPPPRYVDGVRLSAQPRETEFEIKDPAAFEEALELLEKAAAMPNFETYTNQMTAARMRLLPADTLAGFTVALMHADGAPGGMIELRHLADILSARAEQLSKTGRKEEFIALAKQRDAFIAHIGRNPDSMFFGELIYYVFASATATNFAFAAERLGITELAEIYRSQSVAFRERWDRLEIRRKKEHDPLPAEKFSSQAHFVIPMLARKVLSPPPVSSADFEPMRRAEHELFGGLGILAIALLVSFAALVVSLSLLISTPMIRTLGKRMAGVLGMEDWVWVIGLGIVLPMLFFLLVTRLTSLAGREYEVMHFKLVLPGVQYAALLLTLLIAPATAVRWRLGKQLVPFGFGDRFTVPLALAVLAMLAVWSLAALPFVERFGMGRHIVLAALAAPPALCLSLLFANALRSILGKPASRLAQCTTAVAVLPAYPIAVILLCALAPIYSAGEKRWLAKETLLRIDPNAPDLGAYEFKVAAQKRKEINAITGVE